MLNLSEAAANSRLRNRKTDGLTVDILDFEETFNGEFLSCEAVVYGGSEPENVYISMDDGKVHCTCKDFQFTFHPYHNDNGSALLPLPEYENKSNTSSPRAVDVPGLCKHLLALYERLVKDEVIKEVTSVE